MKLLLCAVILFSPALALAFSGCSDTSVAELQLMEDWRLWMNYCDADYTAKQQGQMARAILDGVPHGAELLAIHKSEEYEAEQRKCRDLRDRIALVLRSKYELD